MATKLEKITDAQMDKYGVVASPDILTGTPAENKAEFDRMVRQLVAPAYNAAVDAIDEINDTEAGIETDEEARVAAEEARASAETERQSAEAARAEAEEARVAAETQRASAEEIRSTDEAARISAEEARDSAEAERQSAETARASAEKARAAAETQRAEAETQRASAETARAVWEAWDASKAYAAGNKVSYNGASYLCLAACTGAEPGSAASWLLIADKGRGIEDVKRTDGTGTAGSLDTYTITYSDGSTSTFTVYNGTDGEGAGDMLAAVYDPQGLVQDVFAYAKNLAAAAQEAAEKASVPLTGGTMTGALTLSGAPTEALHAVTKAYVDDKVGSAGKGYYLTFAKEDWTTSDSSDEATMTIDAAAHGLTGSNAAAQAWQTVDDVLDGATWAAQGVFTRMDASTKAITLIAPNGAFAGAVLLMG